MADHHTVAHEQLASVSPRRYARPMSITTLTPDHLANTPALETPHFDEWGDEMGNPQESWSQYLEAAERDLDDGVHLFHNFLMSVMEAQGQDPEADPVGMIGLGLVMAQQAFSCYVAPVFKWLIMAASAQMETEEGKRALLDSVDVDDKTALLLALKIGDAVDQHYLGP